MMKNGLLDTALEAAHCAGQVLLEYREKQREIVFKGYRDVVTDADTAAERAILDLIRSRFPDHAILSEESGEHRATGSHVWVIDPLDGTTNYAHGFPSFSISIGVMTKGEAVVGVVHAPLRGETFTAQRGGGAMLNNRSIQVSRTDRLRDALISMDWAHSDADRQEIVDRMSLLAPRCRTIRSLGSAALAMAYVAAGRLDMYFSRNLYPWDTAAGSLIVTEAGGRMTNLQGKVWQLEQPAPLVTNGLVHEEILAVWKNGGM